MRFCMLLAFVASAVFALPKPNNRDAISDGTHFLLYTRNNPNIANEVVPNVGSSLGNFDASKNSKYLIHGFSSDGSSSWLHDMKDALLNVEDANVFIVDWGVLAAAPNYPQAASNTQGVGSYLGTLITYFNGLGSNAQNHHLIGHSLGAQISGWAGASLGGHVGRISGLDPAWPLFENVGNAGRLDSSDANFVDVVHTNAGILGTPIATGHIDFWPDGGTQQPGCYDPIESVPDFATSCSHSRSHQYYYESIQSPSSFNSYPCSDFETYALGQCTSCGGSCYNLGYGSRPGQAGQYYLATRIESPYSGKHLFVTLQISGSQTATSGHILLTLDSALGSDTEEVYHEEGLFGINPGQTFNSAIAVRSNLQNFNGGSVKFDQEGTDPSTTLRIDSILVLDPATNQRICTGSVNVPDRATVAVQFTNC